MFKLSGRAIGDVITEFNGPRTGWNYGGAVTPVCEVTVLGTGGVKVQINDNPILGSNSTDLNPIDITYIPDPAEWEDVDGEIDQADGRTLRSLTASTGRNWVRVVVTSTGTGKAAIGGMWAKR